MTQSKASSYVYTNVGVNNFNKYRLKWVNLIGTTESKFWKVNAPIKQQIKINMHLILNIFWTVTLTFAIQQLFTVTILFCYYFFKFKKNMQKDPFRGKYG